MEFYEFIRIYGLPAGGGECFQGLGAAALYNVAESQPVSGGQPATQPGTGTGCPGTETTTYPPCPEKLWTAQNELIRRQIAYMKDIKETYAERRVELQGFNMREFVNSDWFAWAVAQLLKLIPGSVDDAVYQLVQKYALKTLGWCLCWLQKAYLAGSLLLAAMADENAYLLELEATIENYRLRSTIITQHDQSIQSLLQQVSLAEAQVSQQQKMDAEKEFFKKEALSERVFECPYSGLCLGEKNQAVDVSEFDIA